MAKSFLSQDWYRVGPLKLRLRKHIDIHRQFVRGDVWFVVQDLHTGKYFRITPAGNLILSLMDGRRTLHSLWELACTRFPDDPPTQGEVIRLLSQLHNSDLVAGDMPPDVAEMGRRHHDQSRRSMIARLRNPLALRLPLFDPDTFLNATMWMFRPLFTVWGFLAWLALVITGITLAALNWNLLIGDVTDRILTAENLILLVIAYPVVKAIHEMGHAYATKVWGGEVHEIGMMFLVFIPVPYVDASASAAFPEKSRRAIVGGAGIMVELALAAIAMIVWTQIEPGLVRAFAFNVMLIGGVSTLLFNGNPLLRFDGYFVLADLVEIPNLGQRSSKYFWYLVQRYILGVKDAENPVSARGERLWLFTYAVAAFFYRISISIAITLFVASKFFFIGVILALWAASNVFLFPLLKGIKFLFTGRALRGRRGRALTLTGAALAGFAALLFAVPVPHRTLAEGVVWLEEDTLLRAETEGFIADAPIEGAMVVAGQTLMQLADPVLESEARVTETQLDEMRLRLTGVVTSDAVQANLLREQVRHLEGRVALFQDRMGSLAVTAPHDGQAIIPNAADLPGRFVQKGDVLGYVMSDDLPRLRVAVPQDNAELVRAAQGVELRLRRDLLTPISGAIVAATPESQARLPSPALSTNGGGSFALDPSDPEGLTTLDRLFLFDIAPETLPAPLVGERAVLRFDHCDEPIAFRMGRAIRQLFLSQFDV